MARHNPASDDMTACFSGFIHGIVTTTMNDLTVRQVKQVLGNVYGLTVRSRNWGRRTVSRSWSTQHAMKPSSG
ncbi:hypothetical protein V1525DRAFT_431455 [Lipomyces kononenkoae]|uniref:Uncharacterized protein n=1 Tax=Lipomyces kononenkoae TaxID=34357 RepID=A0ACC3T4B5_LIPKO